MIDSIIKNLSDGNIYSLDEIAVLTNTSTGYVESVLNNPSIIQTCGDGSGVIYYMNIKYDTIVDGTGFRNTVYCAKCDIRCKECHNPQSWNIENGKPITVKQLSKLLLENGNDITFSGGECSLQAKTFVELAKILKNNKKNIWLYSGRTIDDLINNPETRKLLNLVDVLVDGKFINTKKNLNLPFRGSLNQRVIDVQKSLQEGRIILYFS